MIRLAIIIALWAGSACAEALVAARTLPARSIIGPEDLLLRDVNFAGAETDPLLFIGMETRVALYAGRPVRVADVGAPAVVERNQIIPLVYDHGGLRIATEGRALARAGPGDVIRVMNLSSRTTVTARIHEGGQAVVSP